ncbi:hypothetical protein [Oceanobacillus oncorhynchi]|uniref:hypothetical protein n=1 Tax=Oceanobacillus oncorhynchi TaxID=545501 RepID=UPI0034D60747
MADLKQTYGNFALRGEVVWKRNDSYAEDTSSNGNLYRRIRFGVKTEEGNIVGVEMFQTKFKDVTLRHTESGKRDKTVKYGEHTGKLPDGYEIFMPVNVGLEQDEKGKNIVKKLITYDAIEYINENIENGDAVFVTGGISRSSFEKDGQTQYNERFEIRNIFGSSSKPGDDDFTPQSTFDQTLIFTGVELNKNEGKLFVDGNVVVNKHGEWVPVRLYIDIEKNKKFAMNVKKNLKYGTVVKVKGFVHHTVTEVEVESDGDEWGEDPEPKASEKVDKSLEITKVEKPAKEDVGKFKAEDFVKKQQDDESNPFTDDNDGDGDDIWGSDPSGSSEGESDDDDPFAGLD